MNEEKDTKTKDVELNSEESIRKARKEEFDNILSKIKKMSDAVELHENVKKAVSEDKVDNNYLKYIENSLEDKLFCDAKFDKIRSKILLEVVCPDLVKFENFEIEKLEITTIGSHFEEIDNYIDKICTYDNKFVCLFGINENNPEKVIKYEPRKFSRQDMVEAICSKLEDGNVAQMGQYDEYYVVTDKTGLKVFSERKIVSLVKIEETIFDKIKGKLSSLFSNMFSKKKCMPNIKLVYDTNPNRFETFEHTSKIDAKSRMKLLLQKEREITRNTNS